jgi:hydantoinase/carbamoylase family amidase
LPWTGGAGLRRLALTAEDKAVRDLFVGWAREAGCTVEVDPVGNIFARRAGTDDSMPPVAIGSHLDTQICGGRYDGVLGVMCGLEAIRTLNDRAIRTRRPIELIMWTNEEGARFSPPLMGSLALPALPVAQVHDTKVDAARRGGRRQTATPASAARQSPPRLLPGLHRAGPISTAGLRYRYCRGRVQDLALRATSGRASHSAARRGQSA